MDVYFIEWVPSTNLSDKSAVGGLSIRIETSADWSLFERKLGVPWSLAYT